MTDRHVAECSKAAYLGVINPCVMYKLFIQQYSQKYQSPKQNCHFCLYRQISIQVRSFETGDPLSIPLIEMQGSIRKAVENDIMLLTANMPYSKS